VDVLDIIELIANEIAEVRIEYARRDKHVVAWQRVDPARLEGSHPRLIQT
jgi:hypothetical protein